MKPGGLLDHTERAEIMGELTRGIAAKSFPADFIGSDYEGEVTELPSGQEVSMYRELEGIYVMIDGQRLFFNNPVYAKFIFYSAKAGLRKVRVPDARIARKATKGLEQEMSNTIYEIQTRIEKYRLFEEEKKQLLDDALKALGAGYYSDIVSKEELW